MAEPAAGKQSDRSTSAPVIYEARDGVSWITLNRPSVLNALDTALAAALAECVERAAGDAATFVVVVRGAGRAFCSGMDRTALAAGAIDESFYRHWIRALNLLEDMPKVAIAVLHGYSSGCATRRRRPTATSSGCSRRRSTPIRARSWRTCCARRTTACARGRRARPTARGRRSASPCSIRDRHRDVRRHPRDRGAHQGVPRLRGREERRPPRAARLDPRADRAQRGRQDDLLQPPHALPDADGGTHPLQRPRHHGEQARRDRAP